MLPLEILLMNLPNTGWSKETVNCNFFLTGLKITKSGITEPFLVRAHREVLIFWCLEGVRWKKYPILGLCQNGGLAPARPDSAWTEPARHLQTLQDNPQTFLRIVWECLLVSFYAWFIFGNVRGHLGLSCGDVSGCFRCSEVFEGVTEGWVYVDPVWLEPTHYFVTALKNGFDNLMSWRRQVKKIPHFRVVPKWWVGSSQTRFRMDWTCQASSNTPRQPSDIPQDCLRVSVGVLLCLIHLWECKGASGVVLGGMFQGVLGARRCSRV